MGSAAHVQPVLDRALHAFARECGHKPCWAAAAPGRVNLIGEHTDYNGGFVLPIAIDRVCIVVAGPARDPGVSRIFSDDTHAQWSGDVRPRLVARGAGGSGPGVEVGSWPSYILGVVAQFQGEAPLRNVDIAIASSVPLGSGLSSSASLEVAVATVMEQVTGRVFKPLDKAGLCQRAEHEFAGVPCGIMDMLSSISGRAGHAMLIDCESCEVRPVPMPRELEVVVVNSNVKHSLAGGEYAQRRRACEAAARKLGVSNLRRARLDMLGRGLNEEELRCARHVITECERALATAQAFEAGRIVHVGELFARSHESLRDDFRVSCRELDVLVDLATESTGVFGARMTGGGFGGSIVALTKRGESEKVMNNVVEGYRRALGLEATAFVVSASAGAGPETVS